MGNVQKAIYFEFDYPTGRYNNAPNTRHVIIMSNKSEC